MILRYVRIEQIEAYERVGWVLSSHLSQPHGEYSALMEFPEVWKAVVGFEGLYEVSSYGNVRSFDRRVRTLAGGVTETTRVIKGRTLKPSFLKDGYLQVGLSSSDGVKTTNPISHLVAAAFIGPRPIGYDVCHNDGVRTNNASYNLRYDTRKGNMADARLHGTLSKGENRPHSKLSDILVRKIRSECKFRTADDLAHEIGVSVSTVHNVMKMRVWAHLPLFPGEIGTPEGNRERLSFVRKYSSERMAAENRRRVSDCEPGRVE